VNRFLRGVARALAETFELPGPILEIGSYQVPGQEEIADLRGLFPGRGYQGVDCRPGPGVDFEADVESLPQPDASLGTVIAMNTFEHVPHFWRGFDEIHRVLRPDGALLVSCPFYFKIHDFPGDYWRFTPAALEVLLEAYPYKIIGWHGARNRPAHVWALAFREERPPISPTQFAKYRRLVGEYARQPLSRGRRWRYHLGSLLFGRGLFASHLDRERWDTICQNSNVKSLRKVRCRTAGSGSAVPALPTADETSSTSPSASPTGTAASCCAAACKP
jgi:SAM-dependent methyltransferase